jgi:hypothetical protein
MAFYWFTYMIYLFGWPTFRHRPARVIIRHYAGDPGGVPDLPAAA